MLATILKSPVATQATISIIETFTKIRELSRSVKELSTIQDKAQQPDNTRTFTAFKAFNRSFQDDLLEKG